MERYKFGLFVLLLAAINWAALQGVLKEKRDVWFDGSFVSGVCFYSPHIW